MIKKFVIWTLFLLFSTLNSVYGETVFIFNPEAKSGKTESVRSGLEIYLGREGIASNVYIFANPEDFRNSVGRLVRVFKFTNPKSNQQITGIWQN